MTLYELNRYAKGAALREWEQTAFVCALIHNVNRSRKTKAATPDDYNPFKQQPKETKPIEQLFSDFGNVVKLGD